MIMVSFLSYQSFEVQRVHEHQIAQAQAAEVEFEKQRIIQELEESEGELTIPNENRIDPLEAPREENPPQVDVAESGGDPLPSVSSDAESHSTTTPAVQFHVDMASWLMVNFMIAVVELLMGGLWITHLCKHWTKDTFREAGANVAWILPMLAAVGWIGYLYSPYLSLGPLQRDTTYHPSNYDYPRFVSGTDIETEQEFKVATQGVSTWVTNGQTTHSDKVLVPVHGGWLDSQSEAENFARREVLRTLKSDFERTYPSAENWKLAFKPEDLDAIAQEYNESRDFDLNGKLVTLYRTHLQVELSDAVRSRIVESWVPQLQKFRMTVLQVFMVVLMVFFFSIGGCLSIDMRTHGAYTRRLRLASCFILMAAAWGAFLMRESLIFNYLV